MLRKNLLIKVIVTIFLSSLFTNDLFSQHQTTENTRVKEIRLQKRPILTRDIIELPEASLYQDILYVSFDDSGVYDLYIQNEYGEIVYYSVLPANGMPYTYDISAIREEDSFYTLIIEGPSGTFEGSF